MYVHGLQYSALLFPAPWQVLWEFCPCRNCDEVFLFRWSKFFPDRIFHWMINSIPSLSSTPEYKRCDENSTEELGMPSSSQYLCHCEASTVEQSNWVLALQYTFLEDYTVLKVQRLLNQWTKVTASITSEIKEAPDDCWSRFVTYLAKKDKELHWSSVSFLANWVTNLFSIMPAFPFDLKKVIELTSSVLSHTTPYSLNDENQHLKGWARK